MTAVVRGVGGVCASGVLDRVGNRDTRTRPGRTKPLKLGQGGPILSVSGWTVAPVRAQFSLRRVAVCSRSRCGRYRQLVRNEERLEASTGRTRSALLTRTCPSSPRSQSP